MSLYGKKVVAVLDTESTFGVTIKKLVADVKSLMASSTAVFSIEDAVDLIEADNDQLAEQAGVDVGQFYRTGNIVKIRVS